MGGPRRRRLKGDVRQISEDGCEGLTMQRHAIDEAAFVVRHRVDCHHLLA